ncbi:MAG: ATP-binding cassette domain-containing protein [Candidatus Aminicenantes bacterium]|nr:ATP-binding cassette domain-containing protein [Candidatus Aminicenantes bacterium]NLH77586.1 ATP-binding cassette domain-containing protein [Acidobacteriota bacterium]
MIDVRRLAKRFGPVEALRDVSFRTRKGTITVLLGENGAGKTTTLRCLLGFLRPDAGAVAVSPGRIGYVPDRPVFFPGIDGWEILRLEGRDPGPTALAAARSLSFDPALLRRRPAAYSAGNAKKFAFLQALVAGPDLLVADEPYAALDPSGIRRVREALCGLRDAGRTVLLSSHMLAEMERIADGFVVLRRGATVAHAGLREWRLLRATRPGPDLESVVLGLTAP